MAIGEETEARAQRERRAALEGGGDDVVRRALLVHALRLLLRHADGRVVQHSLVKWQTSFNLFW